MDDQPVLKPVVWVGPSREDLRTFPGPVQDHMGYALYVAQMGGKHQSAKVLLGFGGAGVLEIVKDFSRRHVSGRLHASLCRHSLCAARISEKIEIRTRYTAS